MKLESLRFSLHTISEVIYVGDSIPCSIAKPTQFKLANQVSALLCKICVLTNEAKAADFAIV